MGDDWPQCDGIWSAAPGGAGQRVQANDGARYDALGTISLGSHEISGALAEGRSRNTSASASLAGCRRDWYRDGEQGGRKQGSQHLEITRSATCRETPNIARRRIAHLGG